MSPWGVFPFWSFNLAVCSNILDSVTYSLMEFFLVSPSINDAVNNHIRWKDDQATDACQKSNDQKAYAAPVHSFLLPNVEMTLLKPGPSGGLS